MSVHKNVNVCVTTSPRLLMKIDARRTGQQPAGLSSPNGANILRRCGSPE